MSAELMEAFNFTVDDLAFNKRGELSPEQKARFAKEAKRSSIMVVLFTLGFGAGAIFTMMPFIRQGLSITDNLGRFIVGVVLVGLALFFFYLIFQKDAPVIKSAQGKIQFVSRESDTTDEDGIVTSSTSYFVVIGDEQFTINSGQYQFFNQGHIYAIYKEVSVLSRILSIEYIGPPES